MKQDCRISAKPLNDFPTFPLYWCVDSITYRTLCYGYSLCCFVGKNGTAVGKGAVDKTAQTRRQVLPKTIRQSKVGRALCGEGERERERERGGEREREREREGEGGGRERE